MTQHSYVGLRAYNARNPSPAQLALSAKLAERGNQKAFAMLTVDQVLAGLSDEQRAELGAKLPPKSATANAAKIRAQAFKEAAARFAKVTGSKHYAGREKMAAILLANDRLAAEEILPMLAAAPSPKPVDPHLAAEDRSDVARADMRARLEAGHSAEDSGSDTSLVDAMCARWPDVHAEIAEGRGYAAR